MTVFGSTFKVGTLLLIGAAVFALAPAQGSEGVFTGLAGSWGGNGVVKYTDGSSERMRCTSRYSGGISEIALSIKCASPDHNIDLSGKMRNTDGRVSGSWSESNFGLAGNLSGKGNPGKLSLGLGGSVSGSMSVSFTPSHQDVAISVDGALFQSVSMSLSKH